MLRNSVRWTAVTVASGAVLVLTAGLFGGLACIPFDAPPTTLLVLSSNATTLTAAQGGGYDLVLREADPSLRWHSGQPEGADAVALHHFVAAWDDHYEGRGAKAALYAGNGLSARDAYDLALFDPVYDAQAGTVIFRANIFSPSGTKQAGYLDEIVLPKPAQLHIDTAVPTLARLDIRNDGRLDPRTHTYYGATVHIALCYSNGMSSGDPFGAGSVTPWQVLELRAGTGRQVDVPGSFTLLAETADTGNPPDALSNEMAVVCGSQYTLNASGDSLVLGHSGSSRTFDTMDMVNGLQDSDAFFRVRAEGVDIIPPRPAGPGETCTYDFTKKFYVGVVPPDTKPGDVIEDVSGFSLIDLDGINEMMIEAVDENLPWYPGGAWPTEYEPHYVIVVTVIDPAPPRPDPVVGP